ncbi:3-hydroxyacyl-ACP dehydratase FabZ family protein [Planctomycetes bacterium K23_9]|uniref:3-hydroxyacyl-[acyl-carrier-protein] dehydratase FabZ n=1 Tax=Stieleria marina TaxID=1930275 RepID=A0A517NNE6_9BACT|nr:3-hydroxyacyl-[acyl-carrier-protein] dehydratase FabZ [Planctomycetes bacterium K23_9]
MKYCQIDKIIELQPGKSLTGQRTMHADEEYLADHFPNFAVMPGVMMLEALHQAAIWLIRTGDNFQSPLVLLRETRAVKFGDFLVPGETLEVQAEAIKQDGPLTTVKAVARKGDRVTVSARLILERCGSNDPERIGTDEDVRRRSKKQFIELFGEQFLTQPAVSPTATSAT